MERLVQQIPCIGAGHTRGLGIVSHWQVVEGFGGGELRRAVPVAYAEERGIVGIRAMHAIRPPKHLRENSVLCIVPGAATNQAIAA